MSRDFWCAISSFPSAVPGQVHTEQSFKTFIYMQHHYTLYHTNNYTDKDKTTSTHQLLNTSSTTIRLQSLTIENRNCGQINVNSTRCSVSIFAQWNKDGKSEVWSSWKHTLNVWWLKMKKADCAKAVCCNGLFKSEFEACWELLLFCFLSLQRGDKKKKSSPIVGK